MSYGVFTPANPDKLSFICISEPYLFWQASRNGEGAGMGKEKGGLRTKSWRVIGRGAFYRHPQGCLKQPSLQCAILGTMNLLMMLFLLYLSQFFECILKPLRINSGDFFRQSAQRQTCIKVSPYINFVRCAASFLQPQIKQGKVLLRKRGFSHRIGLASMALPPILARWSLWQHRSWGRWFRPVMAYKCGESTSCHQPQYSALD